MSFPTSNTRSVALVNSPQVLPHLAHHARGVVEPCAHLARGFLDLFADRGKLLIDLRRDQAELAIDLGGDRAELAIDLLRDLAQAVVQQLGGPGRLADLAGERIELLLEERIGTPAKRGQADDGHQGHDQNGDDEPSGIHAPDRSTARSKITKRTAERG